MSSTPPSKVPRFAQKGKTVINNGCVQGCYLQNSLLLGCGNAGKVNYPQPAAAPKDEDEQEVPVTSKDDDDKGTPVNSTTEEEMEVGEEDGRVFAAPTPTQGGQSPPTNATALYVVPPLPLLLYPLPPLDLLYDPMPALIPVPSPLPYFLGHGRNHRTDGSPLFDYHPDMPPRKRNHTSK